MEIFFQNFEVWEEKNETYFLVALNAWIRNILMEGEEYLERDPIDQESHEKAFLDKQFEENKIQENKKRKASKQKDNNKSKQQKLPR